MITSLPGEPIWLREGILMVKELSSSGIPVGNFLERPCRGIFLDRKNLLGTSYVKAYIENIGERYVEESEVKELSGE